MNSPLFIPPSQGRTHKLGKMTAVFSTDGKEINDECSLTEWWLEPESEEPHAHQHQDKFHLIYVIEGIVSYRIDGEWRVAEKGTFIQIPQNTLHTFANRTKEKAGFLNIAFPDGSENEISAMMKWFEKYAN